MTEQSKLLRLAEPRCTNYDSLRDCPHEECWLDRGCVYGPCLAEAEEDGFDLEGARREMAAMVDRIEAGLA